jgi:hypothetical protein
MSAAEKARTHAPAGRHERACRGVLSPQTSAVIRLTPIGTASCCAGTAIVRRARPGYLRVQAAQPDEPELPGDPGTVDPP